MYRPLVSSTRRPSEGDTEGAGNKVRGAGDDKGNGGTVAEGLDNGREERVEAASSKVQGLKQSEQPELGVGGGLLESDKRALALLEADGVSFHSEVGKFPLLGRKPASRERVIWQEPDGNDGNTERDNTEDDEEPSPARQSVDTSESCKSSSTDQAGASSCDNVGTFCHY